MYANARLPRICNFLMSVAVVAALVPATAMAVDLPPGGSTLLSGVSGGAGPGPVIHDPWIPFQIQAGAVLLYEGELRDRVVRTCDARQIQDTAIGIATRLWERVARPPTLKGRL